MIIIMVLLWGFSVSFAVSMPDNEEFHSGTTGPLVGLLTSFKAIVGTFEMSDYANSESRAFFLLFLFGVLIVMLNLLIAIMSDSYEKVKESEVVEARKLRAQTIIDEEAGMSQAARANPDYFPQFLRVLQATESREEVWAGLSGKMVSEILKVDDKMKENHEVMETKLGQVEANMSNVREVMEARVDEVEARLSAQVAGVATEVGELKVMMAQLLAQGR